jgi:hypothetical protein
LRVTAHHESPGGFSRTLFQLAKSRWEIENQGFNDASSEMYESEASRDNGIESVKTNGPSADIVDVASGEGGQ